MKGWPVSGFLIAPFLRSVGEVRMIAERVQGELVGETSRGGIGDGFPIIRRKVLLKWRIRDLWRERFES